MGYKGKNFKLNNDDLALLSDITFFQRKQQLSERIMEFYGVLEANFYEIALTYRESLPPEMLQRRGKISRGENYKGLPYLILDYPAVFEKDAIMTFRSLMWWGHPFSFTFHISGRFLDKYIEQLTAGLSHHSREVVICINQNQWEHHHQRDNFIPVDEFLAGTHANADYFRSRGFFKLSLPVSLEKSELLMQSGSGFLQRIMDSLK